MALFDFDKTTIKLPFAITLISASLLVGGGIWRFESRMDDVDSKLESLELRIMNKTIIEIMKVNNRIDLLEAKKFVQRYNFKRDTLSLNTVRLVQNTKTNKGSDKKERHPQVCMILPPHPELKRLKLPNIKNLKA